MPTSTPVLTKAQLDRALDSFDWDAWTPELKTIVQPAFEAVAIAQAESEAGARDWVFDANDPFLTRHFTSYLGERITQLSDTTRETVTDELRRALESDTSESLQDLAGALVERTENSAAFSQARALMIARTETANAYNTGAVAAFRQNGIQQVEVTDGDGDEECEEADGAIWSLDEALAEPTAHPNCTRSFAPVLDDEGEG